MGPGVKGGDAWGGGEAGVGLRPAQSGGRAGSRGVVLRWKKMDCSANSEISRDLNVNKQ